MKHKLIAAIALPCALGVGLAYVFASRTAGARTNADTSDGAALSELQAEVKQLKQELSARRTERAVEVLKAARHGDSNAPDGEGAEEEAQGQPGPAALSAAATSARPLTEEEAGFRLENRFASEPVDAAWRREATAILQRQFTAKAGPGSRVTEIDCKQSLCRVEMVHKDFDTYRDFGHATFTSSSAEWRGGAMMHVVGDREAGEVKSIAYLARPGEDIGLIMQEEP